MKLGLKLLAAPLMTALVVLLVGQLNSVLMTQQADRALTASKVALEDFKTIGAAQQQMAQAHTNVYRTVSVIGSMDEAKVKSVRTELSAQLQGLKRVVSDMGGGPGKDAGLTTVVSDLKQQIEKYAAQVDSSIEIAAGDPVTGIASMQAAEATFKTLDKAMALIVADVEKNSDSAIAASKTSSRTTNWLLALVGLIAASVAVFLSWLTQRKIVAELTQASQLAKDVAAGNLDRRVVSHRQARTGFT